ncbi:creatininase family protein [Bosea sp. (in: a-proteobacteria)]|uniref:creatininase family protein n=1 Tax=Bosea sp. (in: a-proteobacteria) TaxID=1871050 RepID=UPI00261123E3|nr:creatininase family protein [Bosea sp. (in: a-proteobacteria)]MCO5091313.1 creatininase family protein [Bosea sp. (in: a-proteobacteria)]
MTFPYKKTDSFRDIPHYEELTSPDVAAAIEKGAHIIVSTGAIEQHGAHLPLGTDVYQCVTLARMAAAVLNREGIPVLSGPVIPYGPRPLLSECPLSLPGTINISQKTMMAITEEVCRELVGQGFKVIYLLCGHAETDAILQIVAKEVSETTDASVVTLNKLIGVRGKGYRTMMKSERSQSHGGEGETSRMLVAIPNLVRMDKAESYQPNIPGDRPPEDHMPYLGGAIGRYKYPPEVFENFHGGIWGDPANASVEVGEKSFQMMTDFVCAAIRYEWKLWEKYR